jgi:hypothetical protein
LANWLEDSWGLFCAEEPVMPSAEEAPPLRLPGVMGRRYMLDPNELPRRCATPRWYTPKLASTF